MNMEICYVSLWHVMDHYVMICYEKEKDGGWPAKVMEELLNGRIKVMEWRGDVWIFNRADTSCGASQRECGSAVVHDSAYVSSATASSTSTIAFHQNLEATGPLRSPLASKAQAQT